MMRKTLALSLAAVALVVTTAALVSPAQAIPTYPDHCSKCHPPDPEVAVTVRQLAVDGANATYSVEVSSTPGFAGWAVFSDSAKVTYGLQAIGQFTVPVGSTYTVFGVAHQTNHSGAVIISPVAPTQSPSSTPPPVPPAPTPSPSSTPPPVPSAPALLTMAGPATCPYRSANLSISFKTAMGAFIAGEPVELQSSSDGSLWSSLSTVNSGVAALAVHVAPTSKTFYRLVYGGDASFEATVSAAMVITPRTLITTPSAPKRVKHRTTFSVRGSILPAKHAGVRLYAYRLRRGRWVLTSTFACKVGRGGYSRRIKIASKGVWRIRARFAGDTQNAATWSGYKRITVK